MVRETVVQSQVKSYKRLKNGPSCLTLNIIRDGPRVKGAVGSPSATVANISYLYRYLILNIE